MSLKRVKAWIVSFRLRTLPLSVSCVIIGSFLAAHSGRFDPVVFALAAATTLLLQILSNISNEFGDMTKGTDSADRVGPERSLQRGDITLSQMKKMIVAVALLAAASGLSLVVYATDSYFTVLFLLAGASAIAAAVKYTVGKNPYGYRAMGDLFVFIFFGPVGVLGTFFLHTGFLRADIILPSITTGVLSVAVLNLNNMRDVENDVRHGKITLASILGKKRSRVYHLMLLAVPVAASLTFAAINTFAPVKFIYAVSFIPLLSDMKAVFSYSDPEELDQELKKVAASNLLHSFFLGIALLI